MDKLRVLIVAEPSALRDTLIEALAEDRSPSTGSGHRLEVVGVVASPGRVEAAVRETRPDIVLIDQTLGGRSTLPLTRDLTTHYPETVAVAITHEGDMGYVREAMLAGARGFVTTPVNNGELAGTLHQIHHLEQTRRAHLVTEAPRPDGAEVAQGRVVAIYSPKGGVGKTTLAVNLAIALHGRTGGKVALMDSNPQFGHLGLVLNTHSNYSVKDLVSHLDRLDPDLINDVMTVHTSGIQLLVAPPDIEHPDVFSPNALREILGQLQHLFDWIIVDTWPALTDGTLDVLDAAEPVLIVITPDIVTLRDTRRFLELAASLNYPMDKIQVILNRAGQTELSLDVIEEGLGQGILMVIPDDEPLVTHALNQGVPLILSDRRHPIAKAIAELADWLATDQSTSGRRQRFATWLNRLLGLDKEQAGEKDDISTLG